MHLLLANAVCIGRASSQLKSSDSHLWDSTLGQGHSQMTSCVC